MKKVIAVLYLFIVVLSCLSFCGCDFNDNVDVEISEKLIEDYYKEFKTKISLKELNEWYCGTYSGNIAFYDYCSIALHAIMTVRYAGIKYTYPDSRQILIYSDGEFYTVGAALKMGLIGYFDIYSIYFRHDMNKFEDRYFD